MFYHVPKLLSLNDLFEKSLFVNNAVNQSFKLVNSLDFVMTLWHQETNFVNQRKQQVFILGYKFCLGGKFLALQRPELLS